MRGPGGREDSARAGRVARAGLADRHPDARPLHVSSLHVREGESLTDAKFRALGELYADRPAKLARLRRAAGRVNDHPTHGETLDAALLRVLLRIVGESTTGRREAA